MSGQDRIKDLIEATIKKGPVSAFDIKPSTTGTKTLGDKCGDLSSILCEKLQEVSGSGASVTLERDKADKNSTPHILATVIKKHVGSTPHHFLIKIEATPETIEALRDSEIAQNNSSPLAETLHIHIHGHPIFATTSPPSGDALKTALSAQEAVLLTTIAYTTTPMTAGKSIPKAESRIIFPVPSDNSSRTSHSAVPQVKAFFEAVVTTIGKHGTTLKQIDPSAYAIMRERLESQLKGISYKARVKATAFADTEATSTAKRNDYFAKGHHIVAAEELWRRFNTPIKPQSPKVEELKGKLTP